MLHVCLCLDMMDNKTILFSSFLVIEATKSSGESNQSTVFTFCHQRSLCTLSHSLPEGEGRVEGGSGSKLLCISNVV